MEGVGSRKRRIRRSRRNGVAKGRSGSTKPSTSQVVRIDLSEREDVVDIAAEAFARLPNLKEVIFNSKTKSIGPGAFYSCSSLLSVEIPNGVTSIGPAAFRGSGLLSVDIPNGVTSLENDTFRDCSSLMSVHFPEGLFSIGTESLRNCPKLMALYLPKTVRRIGFRACEGSGLRRVEISPEAVVSIEDCAFYRCVSLTHVQLPEGLTEIGRESFAYCGLVDLRIPPHVKTVGIGSFRDCHNLASVYIADGVRTICVSAFHRCLALVTVRLPPGLVSLGDRAFAFCEALTSLALPPTITVLKDDLICGCTSFRGVYAPNVVTAEWYRLSPRMLRTTGEVVVLGGLVKEDVIENLGWAKRVCCVGSNGVVLAGRRIEAPADEDWRLVGKLSHSPLDE